MKTYSSPAQERKAKAMLGNKRGLGYRYTADALKRVSEAKKGDKHPGWVGDDVGYSGVHQWIHRHKPRTGICQGCGKKPRPQPGRKVGTEFHNISGTHKRDVNDYVELCKPCHVRADREAMALAV